MQVFYSPAHMGHDPPFEFARDAVYAYSESPRRALNLRRALLGAGYAPEAPPPCDPRTLGAVHDPDYLHFLQHIYGAWTAAGRPASGVLPDTFALGPQRHRPADLLRQTGYYCFDAQTPIVRGTWDAALAAAACAQAGARALRDGGRAAYALCRPPGHHAAPALCGGSSFLNNAALAARALPGRTAVLDIDYHHGNGTQAVFYDEADTLFVSLHADPERAYPYYSGSAAETGGGEGEGANLNVPLPAGCDGPRYLDALDRALERLAAFAPAHLVLSLGLDIYRLDPLGDFDLDLDDFARVGSRIAALGLPTLIVQEGGYNTDDGGQALLNLLAPFA